MAAPGSSRGGHSAGRCGRSGGCLPEEVVRLVGDLLHLARRLCLALGGGRLGPALGVEPLDVSRCAEDARTGWCSLQQKLLNVLRISGKRIGRILGDRLAGNRAAVGGFPDRPGGVCSDDLPVVAGQSGLGGDEGPGRVVTARPTPMARQRRASRVIPGSTPISRTEQGAFAQRTRSTARLGSIGHRCPHVRRQRWMACSSR